MNRKKVRKTIARIGTAVLFFGISAGCAYFLTPNAKKAITASQKTKTHHEVTETEVLPDHFMRFVTRLNEDTGIMDG